MKKYFLVLIAAFFMLSACSTQAKSIAKEDLMPAPPVYKNRAELKVEVERLEAIAKERERSWQEDFILGVAYLHSGRTGEARTLIERTIERRPSFTKAYSSLGMVRFRMGDLEGAMNAWEEGVKVEPRAAHLRRMIVIANDRLVIGRRIDEFLKALETGEKKGWEPHLELANLYVKLRRAEDGLGHIQKALKIKGADMTLLETLGKVHAGMGDFSQAAEAFAKSLGLAKGLPDQRRLRGRLADMELFAEKAEAVKKDTKEK